MVDINPQSPLHEPARRRVHLFERLLNPLASEPRHMLCGRDREPVVVDIDIAAKVTRCDSLRLDADQRSHLLHTYLERGSNVVGQRSVRGEAIDDEDPVHR